MGLEISKNLLLVSLATLAFGWMASGLGITRNILLPLLALPTMFALAYLTSWPAHVLAIPFAGCLALSLSVAERRLGGRRGSLFS